MLTDTLVAALKDLDLAPGYCVFDLRGMRVQVTITRESITTPSGYLDYSEEMLDPWVVEGPGTRWAHRESR